MHEFSISIYLSKFTSRFPRLFHRVCLSVLRVLASPWSPHVHLSLFVHPLRRLTANSEAMLEFAPLIFVCCFFRFPLRGNPTDGVCLQPSSLPNHEVNPYERGTALELFITDKRCARKQSSYSEFKISFDLKF